MMSDEIYVNFLPWLTIYKDVKLGKVTFWNYEREADEQVEDEKIRKRLERHFDSYRSSNNSRFSITICSYEGKSFYNNLDEQEFIHLQEAITCLVFASTIEKIERRIQTQQKHEVPPSINSFDLMSRSLNINSDNYAHVSLSLIDLGLRDGNILFQKPFGARGEVNPSRKWIKYLNTYLALKDSSKLKTQISRSLEFFRIAQAQDDLKDNSPDTSFFTRSVLLATAFESLLNFPKDIKADFFSNYINDRFKIGRSRKSTRKFWNNKRTICRLKTRSTVAWWAFDFYKLRNSIVHGDSIDFEKLRFKKGLWFSQMDVACLVFADCLEEIIRARKLIKGKKIKIGRSSIDDLFIDDLFESRGQKNWEKHHKSLGWIK